jgi:kumamolisin
MTMKMTKTSLCVLAAAFSFMVAVSATAFAQDAAEAPDAQATSADQAVQPEIFHRKGTIVVPDSSVVRNEDIGVRAHTNHLIFVPEGHPIATATPLDTFAETPYSMACVYKVGTTYAGCNPSAGGTANLAKGGWGAIALVDAYDNPNAASDLKFFSTHWGLPAANFTKVYANSSFGTLNGLTASCSGKPAGNMHWGLEEDLDIEWAHAMAPNAKIILVEACSSGSNDLFFAEQVAGMKVKAAGGGDISNSFGFGEFSGQASYDQYLYKYYWYRTTYFASAGDSGWGSGYPSDSPWVVSAGGTTVNRDASGNFVNETCWSGSGGGVSTYETWPSQMGPWADYQYELAGQSARQTPDIAFNADPASGVLVYDTYESTPGWYTVGGTSVASPSLAGIVNSANNQQGQAPPTGGKYSTHENNMIYSQLYAHTAYSANFYDVKLGSNGTGHNAGAGYDQCTGIGSVRGKLGK